MPASRASIGRFAVAAVLASIFGALTAFAATIIFVFLAGKPSEKTPIEAGKIGLMMAFWALIICAVYAVIAGAAAFAYVRTGRGAPSLAAAIVIALVIGATPFVAASFAREDPFEAKQLFIPIVAVVCSIATAWAFWRAALSTNVAEEV